MAVDGSYQIEMDTPMGKQKAVLILKANGNTLSGTADTPLGKKDFTGTIKGNVIAWKTEVEGPVGTINLEFTCAVSGCDISGKAKAGVLGSFPFRGKKI